MRCVTPEDKVTLEETLQQLPDDAARARRCAQLAARARQRFATGKTQSERRVVISASRQYQGLSVAAREITGRVRWVRSGQAKDCVDEDQFFSRLAMLYAALAGLPDQTRRERRR